MSVYVEKKREREREGDVDMETVNTGPCNSTADSPPLTV